MQSVGNGKKSYRVFWADLSAQVRSVRVNQGLPQFRTLKCDSSLRLVNMAHDAIQGSAAWYLVRSRQ